MVELERIGADTIRLERILDAPVETVWRYLTESELRKQWFAGGEMEPRVGGTVDLLFDHDNLSADDVPYPERFAKGKGAVGHEKVEKFEAPRVLAFSWSGGREGTAEFVLFPQGDKTRLILTHSGISGPGPMTNYSGGWHAHMAVLQGVLSGKPVQDFWALHAQSEAAVAGVGDVQSH